MIMRYQRVIPDSLNSSNGRRTNSTSIPNWKTCKEDEVRVESNGHTTTKTSSNFEGKGLTRFRSPSKTSQDHHIGNGNGSAIGGAEAEVPNSPPTATSSRNHQNLDSNVVVGGGGSDSTFLQWGHRKRSRCSRGMALTDDTFSSTSTLHCTKLQRRLVSPQSLSPNSNANANAMLPPSSHPSSNGISRGSNHKTLTKNTSSSPSPVRRNLEERSGGVGNKSTPSNSGGGSSRAVSSRSRVGKRSPSRDKKTPSLSSASARDEKTNACSVVQEQQHQEEVVAAAGDINHIVSPPQQGGGGCCSMNDDNSHDNNNAVRTAKMAGGGGEKVNNGGGSEVNEWPRIYIQLSRKEKEEDFLAMKGTKLPHRPKKRPKTIDRMLQYCFPGMWLSDLTRGRYEVREKKCPRKQKRRGLKGMESLESDSE